MRKQAGQKRPVRMLMLSLAILLIGGGLALFAQLRQEPTPSQASSDSVVGPPSLPASLVDTIFRRLGSPMVGTGQAVEAASRATNIDDAFALAVWWTETNDGATGVGLADRNPGSVRGSTGYPSAYDGYTIYPSYTAAVNYWFPMLKRSYINRGLTTVSAIAHPYVGTSTSYLWAEKVITLMNRYRSEAPAPTATPKPKPTMSAGLQRVRQTLAQQAQQQAASGTTPAPTVSPQMPQPQNSQSFVSVLAANAKLLLFLFSLFLALVIGLWAWRVSMRRSGRRQPLVQPLSHQPIGNLWEDLRASQQRPATFFGQRSLSGLLVNTEALSIGVHTPETGALAVNAPEIDLFGATNPLQPAYRTAGARFSPGNFTASQARFQFPQTPQPASISGGLPPFGSGQLLSDAPVSAFTGQLPFTRQLLFDTPVQDFVEQLPFDAPVIAFTGQLAPSPGGQMPVYPQSAPLADYPTYPTSTYSSALHAPRRTQLQPATPATSLFRPSWPEVETSARRLQLVGVGSSGERSHGLLSRYRQAQTQEDT